ncbi:hypothetical protein DMA11_15540 [Marinilabiliaceae bacterium JC017]|nr:hypothetical protein DMA11_15540 [Marinilabiliaceae bacterium JC017]
MVFTIIETALIYIRATHLNKNADQAINELQNKEVLKRITTKACIYRRRNFLAQKKGQINKSVLYLKSAN